VDFNGERLEKRFRKTMETLRRKKLSLLRKKVFPRRKKLSLLRKKVSLRRKKLSLLRKKGTCKNFCVNGYTTTRSKYGLYKRTSG
jgi:hypothetical protein